MSNLSLKTVLRLIVVFSIIGLSSPAREVFPEELKIGQIVPSFKLPTLLGDETISSQDLFSKSRLTVLIFWTSYCPDCWKAIKSCHDLSLKIEDLNVNVLGINFDHENLASVRRFIKGEKIAFTNLSDFQGIAARLYRTEFYDFSVFIIDQKGVLKHVCYDHPPDVDKLILKEVHALLKEESQKESTARDTTDQKRMEQ